MLQIAGKTLQEDSPRGEMVSRRSPKPKIPGSSPGVDGLVYSFGHINDDCL